MLRNVSAVHVIMVLVVVLLLFGANRLPGLAKSIGQSMKIFKNEVKDLADDGRRGTTTPDPVVDVDPVTGTTTGTAPAAGDVPPPPPAAPAAPPRA
ncbi:twin-arginine translocase TatA/TatE family subunit [Cellulomonas sp. zg-ZUI222]|uniref:Sec-independent protein translocase protein TatA n=1 Tax=Cellulomonas wangleii TaxID=2816956 RepID=A0ABX8D1F2_9CELL|nr:MULTISPECIES: twin-arginine translocase TatA/TatE family subunit [Cellulomonas]MBO0900331.1 twin-arginine translocase TatA/TatE family subunit [Cellulomonas sp. zg-ZUI22]MBO0920755.1 twin-arginine translocase TatA/TatE family subunit [Cellulomonas wangleii]MBO0926650.1 twin-arginine translocase TatA/TatE family subunit [Cellulomonas wangleii]QVI60798.1 twin-arginine translocase TatA/TatE family subunit [Cellulomonas wangleii]